MKNEFKFTSKDNTQIHVYHWSPDGETKPKGVVQIAHGMAEHALRYERFALALNQAGYVVYANDHRGHGKSVVSEKQYGIFADDDGFNRLIDDMHQLTKIIKETNLNLPVFLFSHSMGSFAAQGYIELYGEDIKGVILSGSNGKNAYLVGAVVKFIAKREVRKHGREYRSKRLDYLMLGNNNKSFKSARTPFDWLSTDEKEVDTYMADSRCGFMFSAGASLELIEGLLTIQKFSEVAKVPKTLPIYIVSGSNDPVGNFGKGLKRLEQTYRASGIKDVKLKLYSGMRHEILSEVRHEEVTSDILHWLNQHLV